MNASLQRLRMTSVDLLQIHNLAGVDVMLPLAPQVEGRGQDPLHRHLDVQR